MTGGSGCGRLVPALAAMALLLGMAPAARAGEQRLRTDQDVERYFATVCGFCHEAGGRRAGKGPQLMGSTRDDEYLMSRIATGRPGRMPAFGASLTVEDLQAIVRYIRNLKPADEAG